MVEIDNDRLTQLIEVSKQEYPDIDFTLMMQFLTGDFIDIPNDQRYFDMFHIGFIVYDLDEEELLLKSTQDIDFEKLGETLPRKINNIR